MLMFLHVLFQMCDFGIFKLMIIPPSSLEVVSKRSNIRRRLQLRSIIPPLWPNWNPLIVVGKYLYYLKSNCVE